MFKVNQQETKFNIITNFSLRQLIEILNLKHSSCSKNQISYWCKLEILDNSTGYLMIYLGINLGNFLYEAKLDI